MRSVKSPSLRGGIRAAPSLPGSIQLHPTVWAVLFSGFAKTWDKESPE